MDIFTQIYLEFDITAFDCQKLHLCACVILHTVESHIAFVSTASLKLKVITTPEEEQPSTKRYIYIYIYIYISESHALHCFPVPPTGINSVTYSQLA